MRTKLSEKVSEATDGLYTFSFDRLSIGFWDGELKIKGAALVPDSVTYHKWFEKDSLPEVLMKIHVGTIEFKGVNLKWRRNYKQLHFHSFEVNDPKVELFSMANSARANKSSKDSVIQNKPLYDYISSFIDVLSVQKLNLNNADVSYWVQDSIVPSQYALKGVSIHAYGFRLDKDSEANGKLLYCDNFDFSTNQSQNLLSNSLFTLSTAGITLNTKDSLVQITKVVLNPQLDLWKSMDKPYGDYVDANVDTIRLKGIYFERKNSLSYLFAKRFEIISSDIEYFSSLKKRTSSPKVAEPDTTSKKDLLADSWTLYKIISPVLYSTEIDRIALKDAQFKYTQEGENGNDVYFVDKFNLRTDTFEVNPHSDAQRRFLYSKSFALNAHNIWGEVNSRYHNFRVKHVMLDIDRGLLRVDSINVTPSLTENRVDYIQGSIDSVLLNGLRYERGLLADNLVIGSPNIKYYRYLQSRKKSASETSKGAGGTQSSLDMFAGTLDFFSIKDISLDNATVVYYDRSRGGVETFRLNDAHFYAKNFLINANTRKQKHLLFECDNYGFSFKNFDNYLFENDYRLLIRQASFTGLGGGALMLRGVELIPQVKTWKKSPDTYFALSTPALSVDGIDLLNRRLKMSSFDLQSPKLDIVKVRNGISQKQSKKKGSTDGLRQYLDKIDLTRLHLNNANVSFTDKVKQSSLMSGFKDLMLLGLSLNLAEDKDLDIAQLLLDSPHVNYVEEKISEAAESSIAQSTLGRVRVGLVNVADARVSLDRPSSVLKIKGGEFHLSGLDVVNNKSKRSFEINKLNVFRPSVEITELHKAQQEVQPTKKDKNAVFDIYTLTQRVSDNLKIGSVNIEEAGIDYAVMFNKDSVNRQMFNSTDLRLAGLMIDNKKEDAKIDDFYFRTKNLRFPIDKGFYNLTLGSVEMSKETEGIKIDSIRMESIYPKFEFANLHPKNADWFDVKVGSVALMGVDLPRYLEEKVLSARTLLVDDVMLSNLKNQNIEIQHNIMPLIYEGIQKFPIPIDIDTANVKNFSVLYEEIPRGKTVPARIFFENMNGAISGLTNIVQSRDQYIRLDANGKLMGTGYFEAQWDIPVDSLNDHFLLRGHLHEFDLKDLNPLITPMAPVSIDGGIVKGTVFDIDASSLGAYIDMEFLYNDLKISVFKGDGLNRFITSVANRVLKANNPRKKNKKPETASLYVTRDPYHSTFNYFWQILQPPLAESVGVSQKKQNLAKNISNTLNKVKNFFKFGKKTQEETDPKAAPKSNGHKH